MFNASKGFKISTTGANTTIFPIVIIDSNIFLSTQEITLNNNNFEPILLNVPKITEQLNIESKKQTISGVTLQISNLPVLPLSKRFSDFGTMKNKQVKIYFCTNTTTSYAIDNNIQDDNQAVLVYEGYIKESKMDQNQVTLVLEDTISKDLKHKLPLEKHNFGEQAIREKDRNKAMPYVFGNVDKSPAYLVNGDIFDPSLTDNSTGKILIGEAEEVLTINEDVLKAYPTGTYTGLDVNEIGATTVYVLHDDVYLNLNSHDPEVEFPTKSDVDEDGNPEETLDNFNSWSINHNTKWIFNDFTEDANLEEFIKPYKNRGYNFHIESLQSKSINFDLIPVCYINSPKSIESFFQADEEGTANQPTAGFATDIQAVGSAGGTPEDFARVVTDFNPNTSLNIKAETDVGIFANRSSDFGGLIRHPSSAGFKITMNKLSTFPCATYVLYTVGYDALKLKSATGAFSDSLPIENALSLWNNTYEEELIGAEFFQGGFFRSLLERLIKKSPVLDRFIPSDNYNTGKNISNISTKAVLKLIHTQKIPTYENEEGESYDDLYGYPHYSDNVFTGLNKMIEGHHTDFGDKTNTTLHDGTIKKENQEDRGGWAFNNANKYTEIYFGMPYNVIASRPSHDGGEDPNFPSVYLGSNITYDNFTDIADGRSAYFGHGGEGYNISLIHFQILHQGFVQNWNKQDYYIKAIGRNSDSPTAVNHATTMVDLLGLELQKSESNVDVYNQQNQKIKLNFTLSEKSFKAKDVIADMFKNTKSFFKVDGQNRAIFPTIASTYTGEGNYQPNAVLYAEDVLKYTFTKTKDVYNQCRVKYNFGYGVGNTLDQTKILDIQDYLPQYNTDYYNLIEDKVLEFESQHIRDAQSAQELAEYLLFLNCNEHNIAKISVPLSKGIELESGDIIAFWDELDDMKLFGTKYSYKDFTDPLYTNQYKTNGQYVYPLWFISKITKSTKKVDIEAVQLHHLSTSALFFNNLYWDEQNQLWSNTAILGCTYPTALNYNPSATQDDGSCLLPQQDDENPIAEFSIFNNTTGEPIDDNQEIELSASQPILEMRIQNSSYDPDDLQAGFDFISEIPNFPATFTSQLEFIFTIFKNPPYPIIIELQQSGIGDSYAQGFGTGNPPNILFSSEYEEPEYDSNSQVWKLPTNEYFINLKVLKDGQEVNQQTKSFKISEYTYYPPLGAGDINNDGVFSILDIVLMLNMITTGEYDITADINEDGVVDVLDVVKLLELINE